jgi:hypothetical protein
MDWERIEAAIEDGGSDATTVLAASEAILENWIVAKGEVPTTGEREGFRLLALHRQGASGDPSFNACRETCREIAYHVNLLKDASFDPTGAARNRLMLGLVAKHLMLFVRGKMEVAGLGEFCCASKPVRKMDMEIPTTVRGA